MFQVDEERFHSVSYKAVISVSEVPLACDMRGKGHYMSFCENETPHHRHPEIINTLSTKTCLPINLHVLNECKRKVPLGGLVFQVWE